MPCAMCATFYHKHTSEFMPCYPDFYLTDYLNCGWHGLFMQIYLLTAGTALYFLKMVLNKDINVNVERVKIELQKVITFFKNK